MNRIKNNGQRLRALFKDLHPVQEAILVERLMKISELTRAEATAHPESFRTFATNAQIYIEVCDKIDKHLLAD